MRLREELGVVRGSYCDRGKGFFTRTLHQAGFVNMTRLLGCCGAIITITALAFTTFTQQLIAIRPFPVTEGPLKPGNIPRSELWDNITGNAAEGGAGA